MVYIDEIGDKFHSQCNEFKSNGAFKGIFD
jgi:hypothetical protein